MSTSETTRHTETPCLNCGKGLDASSTFVDDARSPGEGDFTVCFYCRHVMVYRADLSLRNPTDDEIVDLAGNEVLVSTIDLLGAYAVEMKLEERRRRGQSQAGDEEISRQVRRAGRRAAVAYFEAIRRARSRPE